jgi:Uma2 family endonuclease
MNQQTKIQAAPADFAADAFTAVDFLEMMELGAFQDMRAELVRGVIEKMAPANGDHAGQNARIVFELMQLLGKDAPVAVDLALKVDGKTVRGIDVALARNKIANRGTKGSDLLLAVEVSETTLGRDLGSKAADYARAGVPTYWVVDLAARVVHVMSDLTNGDYARRAVVRFGEPLNVPGSDKSIVIS